MLYFKIFFIIISFLNPKHESHVLDMVQSRPEYSIMPCLMWCNKKTRQNRKIQRAEKKIFFSQAAESAFTGANINNVQHLQQPK